MKQVPGPRLDAPRSLHALAKVSLIGFGLVTSWAYSPDLLASGWISGIGVVRDDGVLQVPSGPVFLRQGEPVELGAYVLTEDGLCYAGQGVVERGEQRFSCSPWQPRSGSESLIWLQWQPVANDYDNTDACAPGNEQERGAAPHGAANQRPRCGPADPCPSSGQQQGSVSRPMGPSRAEQSGSEEPDVQCPDPIEYRSTELVELRDRWTIGRLEISALEQPGTHRLELRWIPSDQSPAEERRILSPREAVQLFELTVRRDDTYVGHVTELLGTPFVYWPVDLPGVGHQTDLRLGADCVALVIYGRRRLGEPIPYVAPPALHRFTWRVGTGRDPDLSIEEGDILHFGFQTAVISRDMEPQGELTAEDLIIHTYHGLAEEVPFESLPYRNHPFEVLRW